MSAKAYCKSVNVKMKQPTGKFLDCGNFDSTSTKKWNIADICIVRFGIVPGIVRIGHVISTSSSSINCDRNMRFVASAVHSCP